MPVLWSFAVFLLLTWIDCWTNSRIISDLRCYHAHYGHIFSFLFQDHYRKSTWWDSFARTRSCKSFQKPLSWRKLQQILIARLFGYSRVSLKWQEVLKNSQQMPRRSLMRLYIIRSPSHKKISMLRSMLVNKDFQTWLRIGSNIKCTLVGNEIVDHSDVVGA